MLKTKLQSTDRKTSNKYFKLLSFSKDNWWLWRNSQPKLLELVRNNIQLRNVRFFIKAYEIYGFEKTKEFLRLEEKSFDTTNTDMKNRYNMIFNFLNTYHRLKTKWGAFLTEEYKKWLKEFLPEWSIEILEKEKLVP